MALKADSLAGSRRFAELVGGLRYSSFGVNYPWPGLGAGRNVRAGQLAQGFTFTMVTR